MKLNIDTCDICGFSYNTNKWIECPQVHRHKKKPTQHTPTPDMTKHGIFPWTKEEQRYIVRAVNSHEALLSALKESHQPEIDARHHGDKGGTCSYCRIIAQAEVKP